MADLKISELTNLTAADPANDMIPIVDVSATPPASGSTKRISINNILACSPTATLASATITGDLTVDTSTLKVDSANNRVGIGTATPAAELHVVGGANFSDGTTTLRAVSAGNVAYLGTTTTDPLVLRVNNIEQYRIAQLGVFNWSDGAGGTRMTLNSTGLGVGVASPSYQIDARKDQAAFTTVAIDNQNAIAAGTGTQFLLIDGGVNAGWFRRNRDGSGNTDIGYKDTLRFRGQIAGTERTDLTIDTSGNVGIGVTPIERLTVAGTASVGGTGNIGVKFHSGNPVAGNLAWLLSNDSANSNILNLYYYNAGVFSGRAFVVNQSGNFIVRTPATPPTIPDNEMMVFNLTSNTNLRISVKGTDGTVRTANITLA